MAVRIDKAGQNQLALRIDDFRIGGQIFPDRRNLAVFTKDVGSIQYFIVFHRDNGSVFYK